MRPVPTAGSGPPGPPVRPVPTAARPPSPDRVPARVEELAARSGFAWLPAFSSYEDYEQTLQDLGETRRRARASPDEGGVRREDTKHQPVGG